MGCELRPAPQDEDKPWHWVRVPLGRIGNHGGAEAVLAWNRERASWHWFDISTSDMDGFSGGYPVARTGAADAWQEGYRYLGPAEWEGRSFGDQINELMSVNSRQAASITDLKAEVRRLKGAASEFHTRWVRGDSLISPPTVSTGAIGQVGPENAAVTTFEFAMPNDPTTWSAISPRKGEFVT